MMALSSLDSVQKKANFDHKGEVAKEKLKNMVYIYIIIYIYI